MNAIVSWWWPDSLGAADALRQTGRTEIIIANHYFSNELLTYMSQPNSLILASTDTPWHILGTKTGELAVRMARGERIPPTTYFVPVTSIEKKDAARTLADVKRIRTMLGLSYWPHLKHPVELFLELGPVYRVTPSPVRVRPDGSFGARWYFGRK